MLEQLAERLLGLGNMRDFTQALELIDFMRELVVKY